jgi:hypothetical protein
MSIRSLRTLLVPAILLVALFAAPARTSTLVRTIRARPGAAA